MSEKKKGRPALYTPNTKKQKRRELEASRQRSQVNIGLELDRWNSLKEKLKLKTHKELATLLLDRYQESLTTTTEPANFNMISSTPGPFKKARLQTPDVSDISEAESTISKSEMNISGVQLLNEKEIPHGNYRSSKKAVFSSSFVDPFDLTIDITEDHLSEDDQGSDEDYEPSVDITFGPSYDSLHEIGVDEVVLGIEEENRDEELEQDASSETVQGTSLVQRILTDESIPSVLDDQIFLVYQQSLLALAELKPEKDCKTKGCSRKNVVQMEKVGSALYLKWTCSAGHVSFKWCSQPVLNRRVHCGDLLLSSAILLSGNNFNKVKLMAKFMNLGFINTTSFQRIQRTYLVPSIENIWTDHQNSITADLRGKDVVILGDGRMDSPGHSAQYCTYTAMDNDSKRIVSVVTVDKRETQRKSTRLEKEGFVRTMAIMKDNNVKVAEVVTDAHMEIGAIMKRDYKDILHSHDIWHAAKNIGKKLVKASLGKGGAPLKTWTKHVCNHFWHAAESANTYEEFIGIWFGVLHHVVDEHEWMLPYTTDASNRCSHGPLTEERVTAWLKKGSEAHSALKDVVMDKRLLNKVGYYLKFRSTAELENFQNHILMYAGKRYAYTPPVYRARNLLAALDYNNHLDRPVKVNKDGKVRYHRHFNKKSSRYAAVPEKVEKEYPHIRSLLVEIFTMRIHDHVGMQRNVVLSVTDPRQISKHIAPIEPPPTHVIVSEQKSRMKIEKFEK